MCSKKGRQRKRERVAEKGGETKFGEKHTLPPSNQKKRKQRGFAVEGKGRQVTKGNRTSI